MLELSCSLTPKPSKPEPMCANPLATPKPPSPNFLSLARNAQTVARKASYFAFNPQTIASNPRDLVAPRFEASRARFPGWPRGFFSRGQPFDPRVRRLRPSRSKTFGLALRSFSLARRRGSAAREGRRVAREGETVAGGVQTVAGEGGERRGQRWRGGGWGVGRRVRACRGVFRNCPTGP